MSNEATDGLSRSVFDHFSGAVREDSRVVPPASEEDPRRETVGSHSRCAPEVWRSSKETQQTHGTEAWCSRTRAEVWIHAQPPKV